MSQSSCTRVLLLRVIELHMRMGEERDCRSRKRRAGRRLAEGARRVLQKFESLLSQGPLKLLIVLPPDQHLQVPQSGKKLVVSGVELWSIQQG